MVSPGGSGILILSASGARTSLSLLVLYLELSLVPPQPPHSLPAHGHVTQAWTPGLFLPQCKGSGRVVPRGLAALRSHSVSLARSMGQRPHEAFRTRLYNLGICRKTLFFGLPPRLWPVPWSLYTWGFWSNFAG